MGRIAERRRFFNRVIGPDLSHIGSRRTYDDIRELITNPSLVYGQTIMPAYGAQLTLEQLDALARHLAKRK